MLDIGMSELLVIGVVGLIVIGPKDLPELFRSLGRFTAKMRSMSREFSRAMEAAANESGMKDVAKDLRTVTSAKSMGLDAVKDAAAKFEKWDPLKNAAKPTPATPKPAVAPVADAKLDVAAEATAPAAYTMGPATQALSDQQAARRAIAKEAAEKLKTASLAPEPTAAPAAKRAARTVKTAAPDGAPAAVTKPRAPRKPKPKADA